MASVSFAVSVVAPLLVVLLIGYALRRTGMVNEDAGGVLLQLVFYAGAPALIYLAVTRADLGIEQVRLMLILPIMLALGLVVLLALRVSVLGSTGERTIGTLVTSLIVSTGFLIPFVHAYAGDDGVARLALIDVSAHFLVFTVVYLLTVRFGAADAGWAFVGRRVALAPPLWALAAAVLVRMTGMATPAVVERSCEVLAALVGPAILLALGLKFRWVSVPAVPFLAAMFLHFGVGLVSAWVAVVVLDLEGLDRTIALLCAAAPIGYNSITFSEMEQLDVPLATAQVSASLLAACAAVVLVIAVSPR